MAKQNTQIESEGAEFLVLGNLLIEGIPSYKTYTNMKGYDLIATNPDKNLSARVQVKSRWRTKAEGFIIKNVDSDFVIVVLLNRGSKDGRMEIKKPEYFIIPIAIVKKLPKTEGWGKISFSNFSDLDSYRDRWDLIRTKLKFDLPTAAQNKMRKGGSAETGADAKRIAEKLANDRRT